MGVDLGLGSWVKSCAPSLASRFKNGELWTLDKFFGMSNASQLMQFVHFLGSKTGNILFRRAFFVSEAGLFAKP